VISVFKCSSRPARAHLGRRFADQYVEGANCNTLQIGSTVEGAIYGVGAIRRTEDAVFALHAEGAFSASVFRYPSIYGPRNPHAWEWSTIRRVLDGRDAIVVPDGGLAIHYRLSSRNAAHSLLLAVDQPEAASGQAFNCADDDQYYLRQWIELILEHLGGDLEVVSVPGDLSNRGWALMVFATTAART
jgi:nucleoside-diphosphate-sugar epimerase